MKNQTDKLIGRWHVFADQSRSVIESQFSRSSRDLIKRVLRNALGCTENYKFQSASEFAEYVVRLRGNEKTWSQRLSKVILLAQDQGERGNILAAKQIFNDFEEACPWKIFVDIAKTQRRNTLPASDTASRARNV